MRYFFLSSIVGSAAAGSTFGITAIGTTGYPTAKAVTSNAGAAIDTAQSKFGGASGQFVSASSQYLSIPDSADWYFGTGDFTVDLWVRFNSLPANNARSFLFGQSVDNNNRMDFQLFNNGGSYEWEYRVRSGGTYLMQYQTGARTITTGTWYHVAFVRSGTTNFYIFENGVNAGAALVAGSASASIPDYAGSAYVANNGLHPAHSPLRP
ncbi:MAG: hypothetical protein NTY45_10040 [Elusimicrobia bacterium]|nr:hypothetical protein [Elusimicrobiota bacterium]